MVQHDGLRGWEEIGVGEVGERGRGLVVRGLVGVRWLLASGLVLEWMVWDNWDQVKSGEMNGVFVPAISLNLPPISATLAKKSVRCWGEMWGRRCWKMERMEGVRGECEFGFDMTISSPKTRSNALTAPT